MAKTSSPKSAPSTPQNATGARILVFIPCYNCAPQISRTLAQFTPEIIAHVHGILVVDNRSTDTTVAEATKALKKLKGVPTTLVQNTFNYHLGGSHKVAFKFAAENGYTHVCILHGDDQGRIADMLPVFPHVAKQPEVSWLGSRFMLASKLKNYGMVRILGNIAFNALFSVVTRRWLSDLGSGLNIFSLQGLKAVDMQKFGDNLLFNYYLILAICYFRVPFQYVPISWSEEDQVSNVRMVQHAQNMVRLLLAYATNPLGFLTAEHRATPRDTYEWSVMHSSQKAS